MRAFMASHSCIKWQAECIEVYKAHGMIRPNMYILLQALFFFLPMTRSSGFRIGHGNMS